MDCMARLSTMPSFHFITHSVSIVIPILWILIIGAWSHHDDVPLAGLEATLAGSCGKDMDAQDKDRITCLINKIKTEYASIKSSWAGSYNFPIKPLESVSLNDIRTYLDSKHVDFGARMNALAK